MKIPKLTRCEVRVFSAIYGDPSIGMSEVADLIGEDRSRVAKVVQRLERMGLVKSNLLHLPAEKGFPPTRLRVCFPAAWTVAEC